MKKIILHIIVKMCASYLSITTVAALAETNNYLPRFPDPRIVNDKVVEGWEWLAGSLVSWDHLPSLTVTRDKLPVFMVSLPQFSFDYIKAVAGVFLGRPIRENEIKKHEQGGGYWFDVEGLSGDGRFSGQVRFIVNTELNLSIISYTINDNSRKSGVSPTATNIVELAKDELLHYNMNMYSMIVPTKDASGVGKIIQIEKSGFQNMVCFIANVPCTDYGVTPLAQGADFHIFLDAKGHLTSMRIAHLCNYQKLAEYPLFTIQEAYAELKRGRGIQKGSWGEYDKGTIVSVTLCYNIPWSDGGAFLIPYYKYSLHMHPKEDSSESFVTEEVYLPAVRAEYLYSLTSTNTPSNAIKTSSGQTLAPKIKQ